MAIDATDPAYAGQREYTPSFLKIYDPIVLGFYCRVVWRCPPGRVVRLYSRHVGRRHLDVGPGTGYFLERARFPTGARVVLLDPNPNVLAHSSQRLARHRSRLDVATVQADVLKPLPLDERFDSIALSLVLHCLPGPMVRKAAAIRNVAAVLEPDGVLFGATVLGAPEHQTLLSRLALYVLNRRGSFDNLTDDVDGLLDILHHSFEHVDLDLAGSVALFTARQPRRPQG